LREASAEDRFGAGLLVDLKAVSGWNGVLVTTLGASVSGGNIFNKSRVSSKLAQPQERFAALDRGGVFDVVLPRNRPMN
jgi:hypothetical protein